MSKDIDDLNRKYRKYLPPSPIAEALKEAWEASQCHVPTPKRRGLAGR
jgi:hypothetical protein